MKIKMKSTVIVRVFLLILVLEEVICCQGCWKQEREALLDLYAQFDKPLLTWVDGTDCCQWDRVKCNATTGRVANLDLSSLRDAAWHLKYSNFILFEDLKSLDLSSNNIVACVENEGLILSNLEVLDLSATSLNNTASILSCVNGFSSLKSLVLRYNELNATSFHAFEVLSSKLLNLEVLVVSDNYDLTNDFLPSLRGFTSLKELYLSGIGLDSNLHIQGLSSMLINLEVLDMSWNNFNETDITSALSGFSSLKSLTLEGSQLTLPSIRSIQKLSTLKILDLNGNDLNDSNLRSREKEEFAWPTNLQNLRLSRNSFRYEILSSLSGLQYLKSLDLKKEEFAWPTNLQSLRLSGNSFRCEILSSLSGLQYLKSLDLSKNQLKGSLNISVTTYNWMYKTKKEEFAWPTNLQDLRLRKNNFSNEIFSSLSGLQYLKSLDLSVNQLEGSLNISGLLALSNLEILDLNYNNISNFVVNQDWSELKMLEELYLSFNEFEGPLPPSFSNLSSIRSLTLSNNYFTGNLGSNLGSLTSLEYLDFDFNQFEVPISFTPFANHSNLKIIQGHGNKVILDSHPTLKTWVPKFQLQELSLSSTTETNSLPLPNFLLYQYSLTDLDFTGCKLEGEFPYWLLENNTKMTDLVLRNCSFIGTFQLPSRPLIGLRVIDVSDNAITGQIPSNNISSVFPNLHYLNMSINAIHGSIPHEFGQMSSLMYLLLDGNNLSGSIPSSFFKTSLVFLDISNNHFVGKIPSGINNLSSLMVLSLSNNHFEGSIPLKFTELDSLSYLDLSQNNLTGSVPSFLNSSLVFIYLGNNKLSGLPKRMFNERSAVVLLDLSYNEITNTNNIQDMIQDLSYTELSILLMKSNHFTGQIPKQLCQLIGLSILDLSYNNFSGPIPSCLGKMLFENQYPENLQGLLRTLYLPFLYRRYDQYIPFGKANFTTKKRPYTYTWSILPYMSGIDLSYNKLNGNIPFELGNLTKIRALNLSHNDLTGKIPAMFSNLVQIESLDLSFNNLSGNIPPQLNELTFLAVFSVAHNNLSGATPERKGQFMTFDESSYEGNQFLCGPPLPKSCNPYGQPPAILPNGSNTDGDNGSLVDMYVFWVSFVVSYTSVLLVIAVALYINPYWRRSWFYYIELISTNCYYFIEDNLRKFSNIANM